MADNHFKIHRGVTLAPQATEPANPVDGDIYYDSSLNKFRKYENGAWSDLGSGSGGSGISYFSDLEATILDSFEVFDDATTSEPDDGLGGTPTSTKSLNTSTPITGLSSYRFSKASGDQQGEGFSFTTDIDLDAPVTDGETITVQFRYRTSANYTDGDVRMYYYLVGDNEVFMLQGVDNKGNYGNDLNKEEGDRGQFTASLNATSATTAIRIIGFVATTATATYDIDIDRVSIETAATLTSPIVTQPESYTPTTQGFGTISGVETKWWRVGNIVHVQGRFARGTSTTSEAQLGLPNGWTGLSSNASRRIVGYASNNETGAFRRTFGIRLDPNLSYVTFGNIDQQAAEDTVATPGLQGGQVLPNAGADVLYFNFAVEVNELQEAASNIVSQTQANFQSTKAAVEKATQSISNASVTRIDFDTIVHNDFGFWDPTNFRFEVTVPGDYLFTTNGSFAPNNSGIRWLDISKNGSIEAYDQRDATTGNPTSMSVSKIIRCEAGDLITSNCFQTSGGSLNFTGASFEGFKQMDLSVIGLAGQKYEVVEATTSSDLVATPSPSVSYGTWYSPLTALTVALSPGTWQIELQGSVGSPSNSATVGQQITIDTALTTNPTAGSGIVETFRTHHFCYATNNMSYERVNQTFEPVTVTSATNYYIQVRANNFSGSPTLASIGYRASSFSDLVLRARRLK